MSCSPGRAAVSLAVLLHVLGFHLLIIPVSEAQEEEMKNSKTTAESFPPTVEFALHTFNEKNKDEYAYRLENILSSWQEEASLTTIFSMNLRLRRTICKKFEESLDTCPFQESPQQNSTITCLFTVRTLPWTTDFKLLKQLCTE